MNVGMAVAAKRREKGLTQSRFAVEADITLHTLRSVEESKNNTRILTLYAICEALGITPAELFKEAEKYEV